MREGRWYDIHLDPVKDSDGNVTQIAVHASDITERLEAEKRLHESEERYRSLFENTHTIMLLIDPLSLEIIDANPAAQRFYGYSHEEMTRLKITDININPQSKTAVDAKRAADGKMNHFIFPHRLKSGEIREVEVFSNPVMIGEKAVLFLVIHDITEKKILEQQISDALELNSKIIDESLIGIAAYRETGECVMINEAGAKIVGISKDALLKDNFRKINYWKKSGLTKYAEQALSSDKPVSCLVQSVTTSRKDLVIECKLSSFYIKGEKLLLVLFEDKTESRKAMEELMMSEGRFRKFMDSANAMIWLSSADGSEMLYVNPAFETIYGRPVEDHIKNPDIWLDVVHPADAGITEAGILELLEKGYSKSEYRIIRPDGNIVWLQDIKFKILDLNGVAVQVG